MTVGSEKFSETDIMHIIKDSMSGNEMMTMFMLSQATLEERRQILSDLSDAILFAEGAKDEGVHLRPEIAIKIRWQVAQILIEAYFNSIGEKWDFSDAAVRKYYNAHRADFVVSEAVSIAHILTETEAEAIMAALEARGEAGWAQAVEDYSIDDDTNMQEGSLGWIEAGSMSQAVEDAVANAQPGQIVGPVQSEYGWHVILVGQRRTARQMTLEEAEEAVLEAIETDYIEAELARIRKNHPVEINDDVLSTLGGIPVPPGATIE